MLRVCKMFIFVLNSLRFNVFLESDIGYGMRYGGGRVVFFVFFCIY